MHSSVQMATRCRMLSTILPKNPRSSCLTSMWGRQRLQQLRHSISEFKEDWNTKQGHLWQPLPSTQRQESVDELVGIPLSFTTSAVSGFRRRKANFTCCEPQCGTCSGSRTEYSSISPWELGPYHPIKTANSSTGIHVPMLLLIAVTCWQWMSLQFPNKCDYCWRQWDQLASPDGEIKCRWGIYRPYFCLGVVPETQKKGFRPFTVQQFRSKHTPQRLSRQNALNRGVGHDCQ